MIPLALFLRRRAAAAVIFNLEWQLFYALVVGWREYGGGKGNSCNVTMGRRGVCGRRSEEERATIPTDLSAGCFDAAASTTVLINLVSALSRQIYWRRG